MKRRRLLQAFAAGLAAAPWLDGLGVEEDHGGPRALYAALRGRPDLRLSVGGGEIAVVYADGAPGLDRELAAAWIRRSATAVSGYFGRFPVPRAGLLIVARPGRRVDSGVTYGFAGAATRLQVGRDADEAAFRDDWVLVHEMVHMALPEVPERSNWLLEGNATYVEPVARAQAGQLAPEAVWRWAVEDMPKGQPGPGDRGLDHTHTWGRTYWGGAMFWLLAEVAIWERSQGRRRLQDALRAINRSSGGNGVEWSVERVLAAGDAAVGAGVLGELYARMKDQPMRVDLDGTLARLGIAERDGEIRFDDRAPLAALRRRITQPYAA